MRICDYCKKPIPGINSGCLTLLVNDAEVGTVLQRRMDLCMECQKLFMGKLHWARRDNTGIPSKKRETLPSRPHETILDQQYEYIRPGGRVADMI